MVANHYRWDFIGLSTDDKPTADNPKVTDGSTYYESDTSKLYIWFNDQWYEKTVEGGGGGGADSGITLLTQADVTGQDPDGTDVIELWKIPSGIYRYNITENDTYYIVGNMQYDNENDSYYVEFQFDRDGIVVVYHESNLSSYTVISTESTISFNNVNDNGYTNPDLIDTNYPFEGTDGTFNGKSGIVPAPLEGDGNKFLCSDGTWKEAGGDDYFNILPSIQGLQISADDYLNLEQAIISHKPIKAILDDISSDMIRVASDYSVIGYVLNKVDDPEANMRDISIFLIDITGQFVEADYYWNNGNPEVVVN